MDKTRVEFEPAEKEQCGLEKELERDRDAQCMDGVC